MAKSRRMPQVAGGRRRVSYFTDADVRTIAGMVKLELARGNDGRAAAEQLNRLARSFLLAQEQASSATDPSLNQAAAQLESHASEILQILGQQLDGPSLDVYRSLAEETDKGLALQGRILGRGGDPWPIIIRSIHYLRRWTVVLRQGDEVNQGGEVKKRRTRSPVPGARALVEGLEVAFTSIFGQEATVHTKNMRRCGPTVRFMKAFAALLAKRLESLPAKDAHAQNKVLRQLRSWSISDGLAEQLRRIQKERRARRMVK
jgi:hypothetical protein